MRNSEKGQTVLIIILVMVVALTVGLSLALRSVTNLRISTEEENSQRALSAAEAGIEQVIQTNTPLANQNLGNNSTIKQVNIVQVQSTDFLLNGGNLVDKDNGTTVWLVPHTGNVPNYGSPWNGTLAVNWEVSGSDCSNAAMEIILITGSQAAPVSSRSVFDPCASRRNSNSFSPQSGPGATITGQNFLYRADIPVASGLIARIIPLYVNSLVGVSGGAQTLPSQGRRIESVGVSGTTEHKIVFIQGYPEIPAEFFNYVLLSPK